MSVTVAAARLLCVLKGRPGPLFRLYKQNRGTIRTGKTQIEVPYTGQPEHKPWGLSATAASRTAVPSSAGPMAIFAHFGDNMRDLSEVSLLRFTWVMRVSTEHFCAMKKDGGVACEAVTE